MSWDVEYTDEFGAWWHSLTEPEQEAIAQDWYSNASRGGTAILLIGGKKSGDDRWYEKHVSIADRLYRQHLDDLRREGLT